MTPLQKLIQDKGNSKVEKTVDEMKFLMTLQQPATVIMAFKLMVKSIEELVDMLLEYESRLVEVERRLQEYEGNTSRR
jgi:hypothetical protein